MIESKDTAPILLVIDPAMRSPAVDALNCILAIVSEFRLQAKFKIEHVEYFCPYLNQIRLSDFIADKKVVSCICLGSHANVTDNHPFVQSLEQDLNTHILSKRIPFLGICFSHQLLAHMNGFHVGYLKHREHIPNGKHNHFREFDILHPKLALLAFRMGKKDYFSKNPTDLEFKKCIRITKEWDFKKWERIQKKEDAHLSKQEHFVKHTLEQKTLKKIHANARHEQEVLETPQHSCLLTHAATSPICEFEAFVDLNHPIYSFQTHLEMKNPRHDGYLILKNFIYCSDDVFCDNARH